MEINALAEGAKKLTVGELRDCINKLTPLEASLLIEEALQVYPDSQAELYFYLGEAKSAAGDVESAIHAYIKANELQPDNEASLGRLGAAYAKLNNHQSAADCFYKICQTSSTPPLWARISLGNALEQLGNYVEAIQHFRAVLLESPDSHELRARLIKLYINQNREDECLDLIEYQASHDTHTDRRISALSRLADIALAQGDHLKAKDYFQQILGFDSGHPQATNGLKKAQDGINGSFELAKLAVAKLINESKLEEALTQSEALIDKYNNEPDAFHLCAEAYTKTNRYQAAIELYKKILNINPKDIKANGRLAELMLKVGQLDSAIEHFQKVINLSHKPLHWAFIGLGNAFEIKGDISNCIVNFEKAMEIDRNSIELANRLVKLRKMLADTAAANLSTKPDNSVARKPNENVASELRDITLIKATEQGKPVAEAATLITTPPTKKQDQLRGYVCYLSDSWFFSWKHQWYQVQNQEQLIRLLSAFSLKVFDKRSLNNIPSSGGYVIVSGNDDNGYAAEFYKATGDLISTEDIVINESVLVCAEWLFGAYRDKWISTSAEMSVEGAKEVEFAFFIPNNEDNAEKKITIKSNGNVVFEEAIKRGKTFTAPKLCFDNEKYANVISITAEYEEQNLNNDLRERGIIVSEVKLNGLPYTPFLQ